MSVLKLAAEPPDQMSLQAAVTRSPIFTQSLDAADSSFVQETGKIYQGGGTMRLAGKVLFQISWFPNRTGAYTHSAISGG